MDKKEMTTVLAYLSSAYPSMKLAKETAMVYYDVLGDLPYQATQQAVSRLVRESEWFPSASAIRKAVYRNANLLAPSADEAWLEIMEGVNEIGVYGRREWSCPAVAETVKTLGWRVICHSENQTALRAHFFKTYEMISTKQNATVLNQGFGLALEGKTRLEIGAGEENPVETFPEADEAYPVEAEASWSR